MVDFYGGSSEQREPKVAGLPRGNESGILIADTVPVVQKRTITSVRSWVFSSRTDERKAFGYLTTDDYQTTCLTDHLLSSWLHFVRANGYVRDKRHTLLASDTYLCSLLLHTFGTKHAT